VAVNFVGELPFGKGKKWRTPAPGRRPGGLDLSGIYAWRFPAVLSPSTRAATMWGTSMYGLPNQVGNPEARRRSIRGSTPPRSRPCLRGAFGDERRNGLRGPGWKSFDMSLSRAFRFNQRFSATLRWDVFNLFDTVNLALPNRNLTAAT